MRKWSYSGINSGKTLDLGDFSIPEVTARYIRYVGHGNTSPSAWNSITEFDILGMGGTSPGAAPTPTPVARTTPMSFYVSPDGKVSAAVKA